jgi:hypothetical protein
MSEYTFVIQRTHRVNFDTRLLDAILNVAGNSDISRQLNG